MFSGTAKIFFKTEITTTYICESFVETQIIRLFLPGTVQILIVFYSLAKIAENSEIWQATPRLAYILLRPEADRAYPVTALDLGRYERRIVTECSTGPQCHLVNLSQMLPPVNNILQLIERKPTVSPAGLYVDWAAIQYMSVRSLVLAALVESRGYVLEDNAFIPAGQSRRGWVVARSKRDAVVAENLRYVDNLLLHGEDDLECGGHVTVWQAGFWIHVRLFKISNSDTVSVAQYCGAGPLRIHNIVFCPAINGF